MKLIPPLNEKLTDENDKASRAMSEWMNLVGKSAGALMAHGTTAERPTKGLWIGYPYYDTTLNKPIWVNAVGSSVTWKDAAGTTV